MSDIDFDEIDQAVNAATSPEAPNNIAEPTPVTSPIEPAQAFTESASPTTPVAVPAGASPAIRRSGGRFMDIAHPTMDMRSGTAPSALPPRPVSQPAATPAPTEPIRSDPTVEQAPNPLAQTDVNTPKPSIPDPVNLQSNQVFEHPQSSTSPDVDQVFAANPPANPTPEIVNSIESEPILDDSSLSQYDSPFLENTEVEKRPLGEHADTETPTEPAVANPVEEIAAVSTEDITPQPQPEMADTAVQETAPQDEYVANEPEVATPETNVTPELTEFATTEPEAPNPDAGPANMITPQYTPESNETTPTEQTSPYDAAAYEQPPVKQKSRTWLWILIAILLLAAGGAAGAYIYLNDLL